MTVNEFMLKSGISIGLNGFAFIKTGLEIMTESKNPPETLGSLIGEISKKCNRTYPAVDKSIRRAIENGYPNMDAELKKSLFNDKEIVKSAEFFKAAVFAIKEM